jgi:hypothetical protein
MNKIAGVACMVVAFIVLSAMLTSGIFTAKKEEVRMLERQYNTPYVVIDYAGAYPVYEYKEQNRCVEFKTNNNNLHKICGYYHIRISSSVVPIIDK